MQKNENTYVVLLSTTNSLDEARSIADHLVGNHLVACVNIVPLIHSVYWWNNKVQHDSEVLMLMKTEKSKIPEIENSIRKLHSYETPELIALPLQYGIKEYVQWMDSSLAGT